VVENIIPVNEPLLDGNEKKYLNECIETGWISSEGPFVKKFEKQFSTQVNREFGISVSSGTAALEIAVKALGIGPGDEVILPTFTIISCAAAIVKAGAIPVLIDADPITWNMDVNQIENKITERTKAIMVVHIYGLPTDMDPVLNLVDKYDLKIIEDAAELIGQTYKGNPCGSFGDVSTFSFYPNKHITTGEGGMVLTDDEELAEKCRSLRNLCFKREQRFVHDELGWNYRFTNLQAAIGLAQLEKLDEHIHKKREIGRLYTELIKNVSGLQIPLKKTNYAENIYWVFGVVLDELLNRSNQNIMSDLSNNCIGTRPFFWPMHMQPVFQKMGLFKKEHYPVAEGLARMGFYLPSGIGISKRNIQTISSVLKASLSNSSKKGHIAKY
jgi:perosamine synthetase